VNDKVVVFDRMRENRALDPERPLEDIIDLSLTQTLRRTLFTSLTTFLAILPMGLAGGPAVTSFALPVLFGIVVGTSSSMFIAAPMAMFLERWFSPEGPAAREPASLESESGYL
jgi:SecD/SecF fusion protein